MELLENMLNMLLTWERHSLALPLLFLPPA